MEWRNRGVVVARSSSIFLWRLLRQSLLFGICLCSVAAAEAATVKFWRSPLPAAQDEWLAKMFECDHELDLSHNLKRQSLVKIRKKSQKKKKIVVGHNFVQPLSFDAVDNL